MRKQFITQLKPGFIFIPFSLYGLKELPDSYRVTFRGGEGVIYQITDKDPNGAIPVEFEEYQAA